MAFEELEIRHNRARFAFATHVGDLRRICGVRLE
jgi:hypothetical protein